MARWRVMVRLSICWGRTYSGRISIALAGVMGVQSYCLANQDGCLPSGGGG